MTTPSSTISANNVNTELLAGGTTPLTFNEPRVRELAQRPTSASQISMIDLRSKNRTHYLASPVTNLNIYNRLVADGWDRVTPITYVINSGVYVWSDNTALPALDTGGPFPAGLTLINNGYIIGKGGQGGTIGTSAFPAAPTGNGRAGGNALSVNSSGIGFTNNGYVAGGGGGGGSAGQQDPFGGSFTGSGGGGGAGGGAGGTAIASSPYFVPAAGGAGGAIGQSGGNGATNGRISFFGGGGGGGRILPGVGGAGRGPARGGGSTLGGGGGGSGGGGGVLETGTSPRISGAGGSANAAGGNGLSPAPGPGRLYSNGGAGGGGGWGATGGTGYYYNAYYPTGGFLNYPGGAGGKAIALNGYTFPVGGTGITYGAIS